MTSATRGAAEAVAESAASNTAAAPALRSRCWIPDTSVPSAIEQANAAKTNRQCNIRVCLELAIFAKRSSIVVGVRDPGREQERARSWEDGVHSLAYGSGRDDLPISIAVTARGPVKLLLPITHDDDMLELAASPTLPVVALASDGDESMGRSTFIG